MAAVIYIIYGFKFVKDYNFLMLIFKHRKKLILVIL